MPADNGGQIRLMAENLLTTGLTDLSFSPLNPLFPSDNLTSNFRGRPMKFGGRFLIDATNNKLYIIDGVTNKTITVTVGEYNRTTLSAEIKAQLLANAGSGWNVYWDEEKTAFSITRINPFTIRLSQNLNAIHNTLGYTGNVDIPSADFRVDADQTRFHWPYEWMEVDYGYFPAIGFLGIISDSREVFSLSEMATVRVMANTIPDFDDPPLDIIIPVTHKGIFHFFDDDDYNYRHWRFEFEDNNGQDDITLGYMYLGEFHKFGDTQDDQQKLRYNAQGAKNYATDTSDMAVSEAGQIFSLEKQTQRVYDDINIQMIDPIGKDFLEDVWLRFKSIKPFFISVDPKLEISQHLYDYTFFCRFRVEPQFIHRSGNKYDTNFGVLEWL